jgi:hypothetical protein
MHAFFTPILSLKTAQTLMKSRFLHKPPKQITDTNSLPYYQEGRKGGLHPPFRSLRLLISPRFFAPCGRRFL